MFDTLLDAFGRSLFIVIPLAVIWVICSTGDRP